jgi:hypothetical protein
VNASTNVGFVDPLPEVPSFLKNIPNWIRWQLEVVNGRPTKVPYRVDGRKAASTRPGDWVDYQSAVTRATIDSNGGVGFVVNRGIVGFDLDGCRNPKTGEITSWAQTIIDALDAYTEITPSQKGLRVWVRGTLPGSDKVFNLDPAVGYGEKVKIEVFTDSRYFTVTGNSYFDEAGDVEERDLASVYELLHDIRAKHPAPKQASPASGSVIPTVQIEKLGAFDTNKYDIFMRGTITSREPFVIENNLGRLEYPSQSEADLGFCTVLSVKYEGDADKIDEEFRKSPLYRPKWEREDYRTNTIKQASESGEKIRGEKVVTVQEPTATATVLTPAVIPGDSIPEFDDSAITGIYRDIVDAACKGTTIPRQYAFLAAKVYIGAMIAGKISFEGMEDTSSYYGIPIGLTGTGKGLAWKRTVDDILHMTKLAPSVKILEGSGDSGAGLKDFFFDEPMNAPVVCMIDEAISLGHKAGEKKNPEILDTIVELATKHKFTRAKAARGKAKAGRTHANAHLSIYVCAQDKDVIAAAFPNRRGMGLFERFYGEYSAPIVAGRLPRVDSVLATQIWGAVQKLANSGHMTMAVGVEERIESYWASLPRDVQTKVRLKSHLYRDMFMAAHGRGSMIADMQDVDSALVNFPRQIKIRETFFTTEVPDKIGLYLSRLKDITEGMRRRLNAGEPAWAVAESLRDFQTDTYAYRDNELHFFQTAWRNWESQLTPVKVTKANGHHYEKFIPNPWEHEEDKWK